jgi:hypothetical protein
MTLDAQQISSINEGHRMAQVAATGPEGEDDDGWVDYAVASINAYAKTTEKFMIEDVIRGLGESYISSGKDERAWGAVARAARKAGIIVSCGIGRSRVHHGAYKTIWQSLAYEGTALNEI